jgi:hypothetical protein
MRAGVVAAAATAGALLGLGRAHGATLRPLNAVAHIVVGSRAYFMEGVNWPVTPLASVVHLTAAVTWGVALSLITPRLRGAPLYAASLAFAAVTWAFEYRVIPDRWRPGFEKGLSGAEIGLVYLVLALALGWGLGRERGAAPN